MKSCLRLLIVFWLLIGGASGLLAYERGLDFVLESDLPPEAQKTLQLIRKGGPFPYERDGVVFGNYEKRLPLKPRGYYREYTVKSPRYRNRGPKRIVAGQEKDYYYTEDHYRSFRRIKE